MRSKARGQSIVEFALILPVLLLLLMGLFDFGRFILAYNTVSDAARDGARVAIVNQKSADICQIAAERAVAIALPTTCAPNATAVGVYVTSSCGTVAIDCRQTVQVRYQLQPITPMLGAIIGPLTVGASSTVKVESVCTTGSCPST